MTVYLCPTGGDAPFAEAAAEPARHPEAAGPPADAPEDAQGDAESEARHGDAFRTRETLQRNEPIERPEDLAPPRQVSQVDMLTQWTRNAYRMSHDGSATIVYLPDGIEVHGPGEQVTRLQIDLSANNPREFLWHPDNRRAAFWAPVTPEHQQKRAAVLDVTALEGEPPYRVVYDPAKQHVPFGMEWSPRGDALYVIERVYDDDLGYTAIRRIDLETEKVTLVARHLGAIDWFMPPISRFENGSGPSDRPYKIIYGATDGLYLTDSQGETAQRISHLCATGLDNLEWHPGDREQVLLYFRRPVANEEGRMFRGVYLVDLDRQPPRITQLHPHTDIHTLWFSPKGTYVSWASERGAWFMQADDPKNDIVEVVQLNEGGDPIDVKGLCWSDDESKLAFTAASRLYVYDVAQGRSYLAHAFPGGFAAEPRWRGDEVILTVFEDIRGEMWQRRNTPQFNLPCDPDAAKKE